ncbi:MAG: TRAP transporter large permease [Bacillota bacterium]|nr:TRAP transporter large permease [Bacillota bacterium]
MKTFIFGGLALLVFIGVPLSFALGIIATGGFLVLQKFPLLLVAQRLFTGIDVFAFMAIPFFILAGNLMTRSKITEGLVNFCNDLVGHMKAGLAHVNVLNSMFFAGISGSAAADVAGLGGIEIDMMEEGGYDRPFASAVTAASSVVGPIIPPSIVMVIYAITAGNVSVASLFLGGFIPGLLLCLSMMIVNYLVARRRHYPVSGRRSTLKEVAVSFIRSLPALLMPLIILGGIISGIFTATEASAIAVAYALVVGLAFFRTLKWSDLPEIFLETARTTGSVYLLIAAASVLTWLLTTQQIPQQIADLFIQHAANKYVFLLSTNIILLIAGCLLDLTPAMLILVPILSPVATSFGIHPLHFGLVVVVNLCIGLITPPIGTCLFLTCNVGRIRMSELLKELWPYLVAEVSVLFLITYVPEIVLFVPRLFGYLN